MEKENNDKVLSFLGIDKFDREKCLILLDLIAQRLIQIEKKQ